MRYKFIGKIGFRLLRMIPKEASCRSNLFNKIFLTILFSSLSTSILCQITYLGVDMSIAYGLPYEFHLAGEKSSTNNVKDDLLYVKEVGLMCRYYLSREERWFGEGSLSYGHAASETNWRPVSQVSDPFIPNVISEIRSLTMVGLGLGVGHQWYDYLHIHGFSISTGFHFDIPVEESLVIKHDEKKIQQTKLEERRDLFNSKMYSIYLRPSYNFALSQKRSNPWRISIHIRGDLLFRNAPNHRSSFLVGAGIGLSYRLGPAFQ